MQYIGEILKLLTWPAVILASYYLSRLALKRFEKFLPDKEDDKA